MDIFAKFENWLAVEAHALMQNSEGDESVAFLGDCNVARIRFHVSLSMQSIEGLRLLTLSVSKFYVEPAFRLQGKFTKFLKFIELQAFKYEVDVIRIYNVVNYDHHGIYLRRGFFVDERQGATQTDFLKVL